MRFVPPLNAIVGFSELLLSSNDDEEKKEFVNIIQSNNELLLRLIDDIIDLSKIESGIIDRKKERFNLSDVAHELYKIMQPKVSNRDIEFLQELPAQECWVWLDKSQLKQVWTNFLTNAIKFTRAGHIKMGYVIENEGIRIYVEDTGIGIPEKLQDQIFNRFQKVDDFVQGAGLGLAISKAITEAAGGKIGYTSVVGKGSTFWAWFPCTSEL